MMERYDECIFCQIASNKAPARIVHDTRHWVCFFPKQPNVHVHLLIAPKAHYADMRDCPTELGDELFQLVQEISKRCSEKLGSGEFNLLNASGKAAQQSVFHLHFHYFPRFEGDGLDTWPKLPPVRSNLDDLHRLLRF